MKWADEQICPPRNLGSKLDADFIEVLTQ
jgi:hypothetical protein